MKLSLRLLLSTLLSTAVASVAAQPDLPHTPRDGDQLHPGISGSRSLILSVDDTTKTVLIDPQALSFNDSRDAYCYIDGDTISYVQSTTKHRFLSRGGTLSYIGFENRATNFSLDSAVSVARFPLLDGDTVSGKWTGHILHHGRMLLKRITGTSRSRVECGWTLTDGTDTIPNATRLVWALDMAYADADSIDPAMPDSVATAIISDMKVDVKSALSERLLTERSLWFSDEARYPVLSDTRVSRIVMDSGKLPISMLAMYYPASFQYSDTGEEPIAKPRKDKDGSSSPNYPSDISEGDTLAVGEPTAEGNLVSVTIISKAGVAEATITLFTDSGIRLTDPVTVNTGTIPQTYTVEIPSGIKGVILLRVDAGDESYTRKLIM